MADRASDARVNLRPLRLRAMMTQEELALKSGLGTRTIRDIETGKVRPQPRTLRLLIEALNLDEDGQALLTGASDQDAAASRNVPPVTLPSGTTVFTGRSELLARLDRSAEAGTSRLTVLTGVGGIGKTMLALHWGHRSTERFPGGEIYIDLRGFSSSGAVMEPAEAARQLLGSVGVEPLRIPADTDALFTLYRSIIGSECRLLVLDNARDAAQVRPLLPNSPQVHTVVISRNQLVGLAASHGAKIIEIGAFDRTEAAALLERQLGKARLAAQPASVERILTACAGLPLALAIIGAKASTRSDHALSAIADELDAARLDALAVDEASVDLRAVFSWSYQELDAETARTFRLLGLHPGPSISISAVAALVGMSASHARTHLDRLCRVNLLNEPAPGRYVLHDLLRAYAAELATSEESAEEHRRATLRMIDHYVLTSRDAALRLNPSRRTLAPTPPTSIEPEHIEDSGAAVAWFRAEYQSIRQIAEHAAAAGLHAHTCHLAWNLRDFLYQQGHWQFMASIHSAALEAAEALEDRSMTAYAHRNIGVALTRLRRFDAAEAHLLDSLALSLELGDHEGTGTTEVYLASLAEADGRFDAALEHARSALRSAGNERGKAMAFNALAWTSILVGAYADAIEYGRQALEIWEKAGSQAGTANILANLGRAHHGLNRLDEALEHLRRSLAVAVELGSRYLEAEVLAVIGEVHHDGGRPDEAREAWRDAEAIYRALGHPEAESLSAKLATA
ncbi:ATP-binding protein [Glycomyces tritici]|uniref:Tetratricopeptide repeat protein n=1 Tax=Glycomyces tritici TaxID=2665176 RepID=A0ABT7YWW5_9ACTN|nr:tetratricopeptide repeat protein [Glycomyces tritici]MDN3243113.1 tetratricopeptide repeat protein [Glycomyces tritici]